MVNIQLTVKPHKKRIFAIEHLSIPDLATSKRFKFSKEVTLRPINKREESNLKDISVSMVLEVIGNNEIIEKASRAITSFRLYRNGRIGYRMEFHKDGSLHVLKNKEYGLPAATYRTDCDYKITKDKLKCIRKIYGKITYVIEKEKTLNKKLFDSIIILALSRFNRIYDEAYTEDILLDLMICLEILFINGYQEDTGRKIASSICLLRDLNKKPCNYKDKIIVTEAYTLRNRIVHSGVRYPIHRFPMQHGKRTYRRNPNVFLDKIKGITRDALLDYLTLLRSTNLSGKQLKENITFFQQNLCS